MTNTQYNDLEKRRIPFGSKRGRVIAGIQYSLLSLLFGVIISACSSRPFGYIQFPLETAQAASHPTITPVPTNTFIPTYTVAPTVVPMATVNSSFSSETSTPFPQSTLANDVISSLNQQNLITTSTGSLVWEKENYSLVANTLNALTYSDPAGVSETNFVVYADVTWTSADSSNVGNAACGILFRENNQGGYTTFVRKSGEALLWPFNNSGWLPTLADNTANNLNNKDGGENKLILIAQGNNFTFLVNGTVVYTQADGTFASGDIELVAGTGTGSTTCDFNEAWIWDFNATSNPSSPEQVLATPAWTNTPYSTDTSAPTAVLQSDVTLYVHNQLEVGINVSCSGPEHLDFSIPAGTSETEYASSGTYSCTMTAPGYVPFYTTKIWSAGSYDWTFHSSP